MRNHEFHRALGKRITERRKHIGMTQAELARALGVSQQTVFAYELGDRRVSVPTLIELARIYQMPVTELMGMPKATGPKRRLSAASIRHAEQYAQLNKMQQRFVARIIETLLAQRTLVVAK